MDRHPDNAFDHGMGIDTDRESNKQEFNCTECEKKYDYKRNLKRHISQAHPSKLPSLPKPDTGFECDQCHLQFSKLYNLSRHKRTVHNHNQGENLPKSRKTKCPLCATFINDDILQHFSSVHSIDLEVEKLEFTSFSDFKAWKESYEKHTKTKYVLKRGAWHQVSHTVHYYTCFCSGYFKTESKGLRHLQTQGSCKIDATCPSSITVKEDKKSGKCAVTYVKTHVGHGASTRHLYISSDDREYIAAKIASKVPFDTILDKVQESISGENARRLDLHNIESCYNLGSEAVRHKNDLISVESRINEMKDDNSILLYKPQGLTNEDYPQLKKEDFVLIVMNSAQEEMLKKFGDEAVTIDSTHGMNAYEFELTTLMVIDDIRQGFPCAFLISNRTDQEVVSVFFSKIKEATKLSHC